MTTYGLTAQGFVPEPFVNVRADISAAVQAQRGASTDVSDGSLLGVLIAVVSEREASLWDLGQVIYSAFDPDAATATAEDAIAALTGTFRAAAMPSTVTETFAGTPTTVVPSGTKWKTASTGAVFATTASATIVALAAWAGTTGYTAGASLGLGNRVTNAGNCYECITSGTSAGFGGPTTTAADITDGTAHWKYIGQGTGVVDQLMDSTSNGPIVATAGDLSVVVTPVGGVNSATNLLDAAPGQLVMTDASLRTLRIAELGGSGNSPVDAIRAAVLKVANVTSCTVYANTSDVIDGNGQAPHSVQAVIVGGAAADIAACLWANVAAGINTVGNTSQSTPDSQGLPHTMNWTIPTAVPIYVTVTLKYNSAIPYGGDAAVQTAIAAFGNAQGIGVNAFAVPLGAQAFTVAGVYNVPRAGSLGGTLIGLAASPSSDADIAITIFQQATYDTSRIVVSSSGGTP